tara:strand:- start:21449 stop:22393 length:945 start_codon:yes stop_codon:yes gene_type:complete
MVGKLSDDTLMSGSRISVLFCWLIAKQEHPYATPNDELRRSIAAADGETIENDVHIEKAYCGNMVEGAIAEDVCEVLELGEPILSPPVYTSDDGNWQCSLDALANVKETIIAFASDIVEIEDGSSCVSIDGPIPIEVKTTEAIYDGETPLWRGPVQLQMQMMAVGAKYGILATVHRGNRRHYKIYKADSVMMTAINGLCQEFRDRVNSRIFYTPVNVDDCTKTHPGIRTDKIELHSLYDDVEKLVSLRESLQDTANEIDRLQTKIMQSMQDKEVAQIGKYEVKWPIRTYKAQPEKVTPAKKERTIRLKTLQIKG